MKRLIITLLMCLMPCVSWGGVEFDGTDDFVSGSGSIIDEGNVITSICLWAKPDTTAFSRIFHFRHARAMQIIWYAESGENFYIAIDNGGNNNERRIKAGTIDTWNSICFTANAGVSNITAAFLNGVTMTDTSGPIVGTGSSIDTIYLGKRNDSASYFSGQIKDFYVWQNYTITASDASLFHNSGIKGIGRQISPSNLVLYWPLDDEEDGSSADGDTFVNQVNPGVSDATGNDGANNTGLTAKAEEVLSY